MRAKASIIDCEVPGQIINSAASGAAWIAVEMIGLQALSLAVFSIIAHYIQSAEFGLISTIYSLIISIKILFFDSIASYIIRLSKPSSIEYSTAFWITVAIGLISTILIFAGAAVCGSLFHSSDAVRITEAMSLLVFFTSLGRLHEAWMTKHFLFRALAFRGMIGALIGGGAGIVLAVQHYGAYALVFQQIIASLVSLFLMWLVTPWRPTLKFSIETAASIFRFLRTITPAALLNTITQNCDVVLVSFFFGITATGFYSISKRLKLALQLVAVTPISGVSLPSLARAQEDPVRLRQVFTKGVMLITAISCPIFIGSAALSSDFISLIFGQQWRPAGPVFAVMAVAAIPAVMLSFYDSTFLVLKKQKISLISSVLMLSVALAVLALLPHSLPASTAFAVPFLVILPATTVILLRWLHLEWHRYVSAVLPCFVSTILMFVSISLMGEVHFSSLELRLGCVTALGAVVYILSMRVIGKKHFVLIIDVLRSLMKKELLS